MAAQGLARHDFRFAIGWSGVEVVHAVGDGVIDHRVDGVLVKGLAAAVAASAAGERRQTHAA